MIYIKKIILFTSFTLFALTLTRPADASPSCMGSACAALTSHNGSVDHGPETCEDDDLIDGDGCSCQCTVEGRCGDKKIGPGEVCDPPGFEATDDFTGKKGICLAGCQMVQVYECGDGVKQSNEKCDDGNKNDDDSCSSECEIKTYCGNGNKEGSEECDDGNKESGDGCSYECKAECPQAASISCTQNQLRTECRLDKASPESMPVTWTPTASPSGTCTVALTSSTNSDATITTIFTEGSSGTCEIEVNAAGGCFSSVSKYSARVENLAATPCETYTNCSKRVCGSDDLIEKCGPTDSSWVHTPGNPSECSCPIGCESTACIPAV